MSLIIAFVLFGLLGWFLALIALIKFRDHLEEDKKFLMSLLKDWQELLKLSNK